MMTMKMKMMTTIRKMTNKNSKHQKNPPSNQIIIYKKHPVYSAIINKKRNIHKILATKSSSLELTEFLKKNNISLKTKIEIVENQQITNLVEEKNHQGIAAFCSKLPIKNQYDLLEKLYEIKESQQKLPPLLLLDQISDPHNVGAIIRSATAFGVKNIIFCEHNAPKENITMIKTSVGTIEQANIFIVTNFNNLIEKLKKINYWCIGLDGSAKADIKEIKKFDDIALIIGSEGDGIRQLVKKNCDLLVKIAIDKEVESLNASVATSIALYELGN